MSSVQGKTVEKHNIYSTGKKGILQRRESMLLIILAGILIIMVIASPKVFFSSTNLFNIAKQISLIAIVAVGQSFVIMTGGIDLSVGYNLGLTGIITTFLMKNGVTPALSIILGIFFAILTGALNGVLITTCKLPPFIVTLGTANIARGFTYIITKGFPINFNNDFIMALGNGYWGSIPIMAVIMIVIVIIGAFVLKRTVFGLRVLSIGGNETAALLSGINVQKNKIIVYSLAGLLSGIAGIIMLGRLNTGNPTAGQNFDMDSVAATVVGGTLMSGGDGTILGTLLGALILGIIKNSLVILNVNMYWQTVVVGVVIITVCTIDSLAQNKGSN